jgi:hypothetical protein
MLVVVRVGVSSLWWPAEATRLTASQRLTRDMITTLPARVAAVLSEIFGSTPSAGEVTVEPYALSWLAQNMCDWNIGVHPDDVEGDWRRRHYRRRTIALNLHKSINGLVTENSGSRPTYRILCAPQNSSGIAVDTQGKTTYEWGTPL